MRVGAEGERSRLPAWVSPAQDVTTYRVYDLEAAAAKQAAQGSNPWDEVLADAADEERSTWLVLKRNGPPGSGPSSPPTQLGPLMLIPTR
jgi:hypothetical protein